VASVAEYSVALVPLRAMLETTRLELPVFVIVRDCGLLVVFTS